jgi:hypothetical protein
MSKFLAQILSKFTFSIILFLLVLSIGTSVVIPVKAQSSPDFDVKIEVGFDNHCKFGNWLPIHILLNAQDSYFAGHLSIAYSQAKYLIPISLTPNAQKSISTQIFTNVQDVNQTVTFQLIPEQEGTPPIFLKSKNLTCIANRIVGVITDTPSAFTMLNSLPPADSTDVVLLTYANLPKSVLGLQSLNALFIANTDASNLSSDQYEAIRLWVMQGGHLILGGGTNWKTTLFSLDELLPLKIEGSQTANILSGFSSFGNPLDLPDIILVDGALQPSSKILLQDNNHPLVAQRVLGAGTISLITFDPNISAFRTSGNALPFYDYLLHSASGSYDFVSIKDWNSAIAAVSLFQNQSLPSAWFVLAVLVLYVLMLGPVHFRILRRMKKPEWAWFTTPIITLILTAVMVVVIWNYRGTKPQINQLAVVHQWAGNEQAYADGMVGIFSPRRDDYQIQVAPGFSPYPFAPHNYFNTPNNEWDFTQKDTFQADTLINASEIMPLGILGQVSPLPIQSDLNLNLESSTAVLSGEIRNESDIDLKNAILFYPGGFKLIGNIPANESVRVDLPIDLLSQKSSNSDSVVYSSVYNPSTYYGNIIEGEISPSTMAAKNRTQQQLNLIEAILGNYTVPPVGFLLVGWDDTQALYQVSLPGEEFDSNHITAFMISLPIGTVSSKSQMILPPALFNWFITENSSLKNSNPYAMNFGYQDQIEIYYKLAQPVSYSKMVELIIHLEGQDSRPDFPLNVYLWNFVQGRWDEFNVRNWGDVLISDPTNYVDKNITEIRLKLAENGNGGGTANVTRADISLVVEP